ncbi:MAG: SDR family oxidoreductase [Janthinobacterium lividum]
MTQKTALIVGATGIVGLNLAQHLQQAGGWTIHGLARNPALPAGIQPLAADLQNPEAVRAAVAGTRPTHVFLTSWLRQPTEAENIRVNSAMVRNLLDAVAPEQSVEHVALVTGLKHYLGPFESYGKGTLPATPFREEQGRLPVENFYYAQEDEVFAAAGKQGFSWSVHRPHTIIGYALGNAMNMGVTLAVYASICRETGRPFVFPGSRVQWNSLTDMTDARLLARHLTWASTSEAGRDQAFNVVNGDVFRWSWMWQRIADWFGIEAAPFPEAEQPLAEQLKDAADVWRQLAAKHSLAEPDLDRLASAWHTDADLGRPLEVLTDMTKSRKLGFLDYQATDESFFQLFDRLRTSHIIP